MVKIDKKTQITILLSERIDAMNSDETLESILDTLKTIDEDLIFDVTKLDYISSAGLQVVLKCAQLAQENGRDTFLKGARGTIKEIFQVSGFLTFIKELK